MDLQKITDNRKFWNTVKLFLSNKRTTSQKISLKEGEEIVTDDTKIANVLNEHFINSVRCLAEKRGCSAHVLEMNDEKDPVDNIITRFKYHPSITDINSKEFSEKFDFTFSLLMTFYLN